MSHRECKDCGELIDGCVCDVNFVDFDENPELPEHVQFVRGSILDEAKTIINGERQDQYGKPEQSFELIAFYWDTYIRSRNGTVLSSLTGKDVAIMMVLFKIARQTNQHKRDNLVDAAGYLGILGDMS